MLKTCRKGLHQYDPSDKTGFPPSKIKKGGTGCPECYRENKAKNRAIYDQSPKGKERSRRKDRKRYGTEKDRGRRARYAASDKGKAAQSRYITSEKGRAYHARWKAEKGESYKAQTAVWNATYNEKRRRIDSEAREQKEQRDLEALALAPPVELTAVDV